MISEHSVHSTSLPVGFRTWFWRYTCLLLISMLWSWQTIFLIERRQVTFLCWMQNSYQDLWNQISADWMTADKPTELSWVKLKTVTQQPVPMMSEHSAHSTPLSVGFRTWLWLFTCLLFLTLKRLLFGICIENRNRPFRPGNILVQFSQWKT